MKNTTEQLLRKMIREELAKTKGRLNEESQLPEGVYEVLDNIRRMTEWLNDKKRDNTISDIPGYIKGLDMYVKTLKKIYNNSMSRLSRKA